MANAAAMASITSAGILTTEESSVANEGAGWTLGRAAVAFAGLAVAVVWETAGLVACGATGDEGEGVGWTVRSTGLLGAAGVSGLESTGAFGALASAFGSRSRVASLRVSAASARSLANLARASAASAANNFAACAASSDGTSSPSREGLWDSSVIKYRLKLGVLGVNCQAAHWFGVFL